MNTPGTPLPLKNKLQGASSSGVACASQLIGLYSHPDAMLRAEDLEGLTEPLVDYGATLEIDYPNHVVEIRCAFTIKPKDKKVNDELQSAAQAALERNKIDRALILDPEIRRLNAEVARLELDLAAERARAEKAEALANRCRCIYCDADLSAANVEGNGKVIRDHIEVCPKHPLSAARAELAAERARGDKRVHADASWNWAFIRDVCEAAGVLIPESGPEVGAPEQVVDAVKSERQNTLARVAELERQIVGEMREADSKRAERDVAIRELGVTRAELKIARERSENWEQTLDMFARAWHREVRMHYRQKVHEVDALVVATRKLVESEQAARDEVKRLKDQIGGFPNLDAMRQAMIDTADENKALKERKVKLPIPAMMATGGEVFYADAVRNAIRAAGVEVEP